MKQCMMRLWSIIKKLIFAALICIICFIIISMAQGKHPTFMGYQILRVLTSSMQPAISANTVIITKEVAEEELQVGDIITFISEDAEIYGHYNTHRIHEILEEDGEIKYRTKGDANPIPDENLVSYSKVTGVYIGELPGGVLIGKIFVFLSDSKRYFIFIMLPLALVLLSYVWQIVGYVTHRYDDEDDEDDEYEDDEEIQILQRKEKRNNGSDEYELNGNIGMAGAVRDSGADVDEDIDGILTEEELDFAIDAILQKQRKS